MRRLSCVVVLFLACAVAAQDEKPPVEKPLLPGTFEVGQVGKLGKGISFNVVSVLGPKELVAKGTFSTPKVIRGKISGSTIGTTRPFVVYGLDTSKYADGSRIVLDQVFHVKGTRKVGEATLFQIEQKASATLPPP